MPAIRRDWIEAMLHIRSSAWLFLVFSLPGLSERPLVASTYRISVLHLDANLYQAVASKVIIETRVCADLGLADTPEEAILNWEGQGGPNWLLFTASKVKCDVVAIR